MNRQEARLVLRYVLRWPEDLPQPIAVRQDRACGEKQRGYGGILERPAYWWGAQIFWV